MPDRQGGRATLESNDVLDRVEGRRDAGYRDPEPAYPVDDREGALPARAQALLQASEQLSALADVGAGRVNTDITVAYHRVVELLERPGAQVSKDTAAPLQFAQAALARAAAKAPREHRPELETLATGLQVRLQAVGAAVHRSGTASRVDRAATNPTARVATAAGAALERIEQLTLTLAAAPPSMRVALVAHEAPVIATLLGEGTAAGWDGASEEAGKHAAAITPAVKSLMATARRQEVDMKPALLDLVFEATDDFLEVGGGSRANLREEFYGTATIAGRTGDRGPGSEVEGSAHVDRVVDWFQSGTMSSLIYTRLERVVNEPAIKPAPSLLQELLLDAVLGVLGSVPGFAQGVLLGKLARASAAAPALATAVLPHFASPVSGKVASTIDGAVKAGLDDGAPAKDVFLRQVRAGLLLDAAERFEQTDELRATLALLPPEKVKAMFDELRDRAEAEADKRLAELVMKWAQFVRKAALAAKHGTPYRSVADLATDEGALSIPVRVTLTGRPKEPARLGAAFASDDPPRVAVEVGGITTSGLSAEALNELRAAKLPLGTAKIDRKYTVELVDTEGRPHNLGTLLASPDGMVDGRLAAFAAQEWSKLGLAFPGMWTPAPHVSGITDANAQHAIGEILQADGLTTSAIQ